MSFSQIIITHILARRILLLIYSKCLSSRFVVTDPSNKSLKQKESFSAQKQREREQFPLVLWSGLLFSGRAHTSRSIHSFSLFQNNTKQSAVFPRSFSPQTLVARNVLTFRGKFVVFYIHYIIYKGTRALLSSKKQRICKTRFVLNASSCARTYS